jgi:beta-phosphoglucomutase
MKTFKNFIFDLDGVLLDSNKVHAEAFELTLKNFNLNFNYEKIAGSSTIDALKFIFKDNNLDPTNDELNSLVNKKREFAKNLFKKNTKIFPCSQELINYLSKIDKNIYIATSASTSTLNIFLNSLENSSIFKDYISSNDVTISKPNPQIYNKICLRNNLTKNETVVIEDSLNGLISAKKAKLKTIYINFENKVEPIYYDYYFSNLCDFLNFIHENN